VEITTPLPEITMLYGITQGYLPSGSGDFPAFTPIEAGTRFIKSNQIYFSVAGNNNTQYKSIDLKYEIPLLKEWMVRQADANTTPNLGL